MRFNRPSWLKSVKLPSLLPCLVALYFVAVILGSAWREGAATVVADGYAAKVRQLISMEAIRREIRFVGSGCPGAVQAEPARTASPTAEPGLLTDSAAAAPGCEREVHFRLRLDPGLPESTRSEWLAFARNSYLESDLRAPEVWAVENNRVVGYNPFARLRFAAPGAASWREGAVLQSSLSASGGLMLYSARRGTGLILAPDGEGELLSSLSDPEQLPARNVLLSATPGGARIARLSWDSAAGSTPSIRVQILPGGAGTSWQVNGIAATARSGSAFAVRRGDQLSVDGPGLPRRMTLRVRDLARTRIGVARDWSEFTAPETGRAALDMALAWSLPAAAALTGEPSYRLDAPALSLVDTMQLEADRATRVIFDRLPAGAEKVSLVTAVTMNGETGELLALGSHEAPLDHELFQRLDLPVPPVFRRLQIGSAAKPLFAHALLVAARQGEGIDRMKVQGPCGGERECSTVLGADFSDLKSPAGGQPFRIVPQGTAIDFNTFMARSDNYFAVAMLLSGFSDPRPGQWRCTVTAPELLQAPDGCPAGTRTPTLLETRPNLGTTEFQEDLLGEYRSRGTVPKFVSVMSRSFGVVPLDWPSDFAGNAVAAQRPIVARPADECLFSHGLESWSLGDRTVSVDIWGGLAAAFGARDLRRTDSRVACSMRAASPEREDFAWEGAINFRSDIIPLVLGGGEGRWTTVGLAQAFTRVIAGRPVVARLTKLEAAAARGFVDERNTSDELAIGRGTMRQATRLVVEDSLGTAHTLLPEIQAIAAEVAQQQAGSLLVAYAKTGTPEIALPNPEPATRAIDALIAAGLLGTVVTENGERTIRLATDGDLDFRDRELSSIRSADVKAAARFLEGGSFAQEVPSGDLAVRIARLLRDSVENCTLEAEPGDTSGAEQTGPTTAGAADMPRRVAKVCRFVRRGHQVVRFRTSNEVDARSAGDDTMGKVLVITLAVFPRMGEGRRELTDNAEADRMFTIAVNVQAGLPEKSQLHIDLVRLLLAQGSTLRRCITSPQPLPYCGY